MKQLSPFDANFFYFESSDQPMMIGSLWLCDQSNAPDGAVDYDEIMRYVADRMTTTSVFRRRLQEAPLQLDDPYWVEDDRLDLDYHVRHVALPQPGDWNQLCTFTARIMSRSVHLDRAPWELYVIEGLNAIDGLPPNSFAVLLRFHHAYVDGKASYELTTALMSDSPERRSEAQRQPQYIERPPTLIELWLRTTPRLLGQAARGVRAGYEVAWKSMELYSRLQRGGTIGQNRVPHTIFNTAIGPHRSYGGAMWPMAELKQMRQLCAGSTLNDVMIAIIGGGMRRYLQAHHELPADSSLVSLCPVALRPNDVKKEGGNLVSGMYIPIGTHIADPVERLSAVNRRTVQGIPLAKEVLHGLTDAAVDLVPPYVRALLGRLEQRNRLMSRIPLCNTLITNVPGLPGMEPKYFAGAKIMSVYPLVPVADATAVSHGITGIYDNINLGVLADRQVVPDMPFYIDCMRQSADEYRDCLGRKAKPDAAVKPAYTALTDGSTCDVSKPVLTRKSRKAAAKQAAVSAPVGDGEWQDSGKRKEAVA